MNENEQIWTSETYQKAAARTLIARPEIPLTVDENVRVYRTVVLAREVGALAEIVKKKIFHRHKMLDEDNVFTLLGIVGNAVNAFTHHRTLLDFYQDRTVMLFWNVVGLVGETGEVCALAIQYLLHGEFDREKWTKELGDCLWYLNAICTKMDIRLNEVMEMNIEKLRVRYPEGFSSEKSINRVERQSYLQDTPHSV